MWPWQSNGGARGALVLSTGWLVLGAIVVMATGAFTRDAAASPSNSTFGRAVRFDGADPCTNTALVFDGRIVVNSSAVVDGGRLHLHGTVMATGALRPGTADTEQRVDVEQPFDEDRMLTPGPLEPFTIHLPLVERPTVPVTILTARLQPFWSGSGATVSIVDTAPGCAGVTTSGGVPR